MACNAPAMLLVLGHFHNMEKHCYSALCRIKKCIRVQQRKAKAEKAAALGGKGILWMENLHACVLQQAMCRACQTNCNGHAVYKHPV